MIAGLYDCFKHWSERGTVWLYSDTHFGDSDLKHRPSDEEQIKRINSKVGKYDTIIFLGDVGDLNAVRQIRGYKVLVAGNHDAGRTNYERQIITQLFSKELYTKKQVLDLMKTMYPNCRYSVEERLQLGSFFEASADNMLFDEIYEGPLMIGEKLILSHEPIENISWAFNIHGHVHDLSAAINRSPNHFNCCAEAINHTPVNFNQWMREGHLKHIESIHRATIDRATRKKGRRY